MAGTPDAGGTEMSECRECGQEFRRYTHPSFGDVDSEVFLEDHMKTQHPQAHIRALESRVARLYQQLAVPRREPRDDDFDVTRLMTLLDRLDPIYKRFADSAGVHFTATFTRDEARAFAALIHDLQCTGPTRDADRLRFREKNNG